MAVGKDKGPALTGAQKAAVVFLHLSESTAAEIFKGLSRREIKMLSMAAKEVEGLTMEEVEQICASFLSDLKSTNHELKQGHAYVTKLASQSLGPQKAAEFLGEDNTALIDTLADVDSKTIANLIRKEHPQTVALILAHLPPMRAAEVLGLLPARFQADILRRVASLDAVSPMVVELVDEALLSDLALMGKGLSKKVGGINIVADILNQMERSKEQSLMTEMEQADSALAESVRSLMFTFDDLLSLDGKSLQTLLKEVNRDTLVLALKAADEDLKQHIFKNLSQRAVEMIMEDMENRGPVRLSDVEKAQAEVVRVALTLTSSGAIQLSKGGEDAFV